MLGLPRRTHGATTAELTAIETELAAELAAEHSAAHDEAQRLEAKRRLDTDFADLEPS